MWVIVVYDIVSTKRRNRVARELEGRAFRVQKSVFEGEMDEDCVRSLRDVLSLLIDSREDAVRMYLLPSRLSARLELIGVGRDIRSDWLYLGNGQ